MSESPAPGADYSLRILWSLARWIEDTKGSAVLREVAANAGIAPESFDGSTVWVSHEQIEKLLRSAHDLAGDDATFRSIFAYRFKESYGAFRHMVWAVSPQSMNEAAAKMAGRVMTNVGKFDVLKSERDFFSFRYTSQRRESKLLCISRQVAWSLGSTMWGNPPAQVREDACIANGDPYCEYHLRWFNRSRAFPVIGGVLAGAGASVAMMLGGNGVLAGHAAAVTLPMLGAAIAYVIELRRTSAVNIKFAQELNEVMREVGQQEAETRSEIVALHQRQREWIRLMEHQVTDRTTKLERIVEGLDELQQSRVSTIRGFSHDLRNPLFVVRGNTQFLRERFKDGDEGEALRDMDAAAAQIETMLSKLMEVASAETGFVQLSHRSLRIAPLGETLWRRLKALVHGRDIKASVFCTREAPEQIVIDPLVFDRVVDNLLTNAAKYTARGSILLEISGTPAGGDLPGDAGFLTLKLSDTGEGIAPSNLERIFRPRPSNEPSGPNSYGIGLSSVVRLMAQIGGRLDVMSKVDVGTTFWAHFPEVPSEADRMLAGDDNLESMITRVVKIRKAEGI